MHKKPAENPNLLEVLLDEHETHTQEALVGLDFDGDPTNKYITNVWWIFGRVVAWKLAPLSLLQLPYDYIKINFGADEIGKKKKLRVKNRWRHEGKTGDRLVIQKTDSHASHDIYHMC